MEDENDSVVRNCTCCRNVIDPGLICVRQHLKPTTTKEINPCNCFCDDDEEVEDFQPPPNASSGRAFLPPQQNAPQQRGPQMQQRPQMQQQPQRAPQGPPQRNKEPVRYMDK